MTVSERFTKTRRRRGIESTLYYRAEVSLGVLKECHRKARWFEAIGGAEAITAVRTVRIDCEVCDYPDDDHMKRYGQTVTEVETKHGIAVVIDYKDGSELSGFVGRNGVVRNMGCWRKYGSRRGHGVLWMHFQRNPKTGRRVNPQAAKAEDACPAEVYARLASDNHPWSKYDKAA